MPIILTQGPRTITLDEGVDLQMQHIAAPPAANAAPRVDAVAVLRADGQTVDLQGTLLDDDRIPVPAMFLWRVVSPANSASVTIADRAALTTTAVISAAGAYVFELAASDGQLAGVAQTRVSVVAANQPPLVDAGLDAQGVVGTTIQLDAVVVDEDPASVTFAWSGPPEVSFSDATAQRPTLALGSVPGTYTVTVTATDAAGLSSSDSLDVQVRDVVTPPPPPPVGQLRVGAGLHSIAWYEDDAPLFLNRMREGDGWVWSTLAGWGDGTPQPLTPDGYPQSILPGQLARTLITARPAGAARLTWAGTGTVQIIGPSIMSVAESDNSIDVTMSGIGRTDSPTFIDILATDPADPVRDIQLVPAGVTPVTDMDLLPATAAALAGMHCLRGMDWAMVNTAWWNDKVVSANPPELPQRTYSDFTYGCGPEVIIGAAAQVGADAWVNLHDAISDAAAVRYAQRCRAALAPGQTLYVELSNEVWNWSFNQGGRYINAGNALGIGDGTHRPYLSYRLNQLARIFAAEFGTEFGSRCKMVLAHIVDAEAQNRDLFDRIYWREFLEMLNLPGEDGVPLMQRVHAVASHGYVGNSALLGASSVQQVFDRMNADVGGVVAAHTFFAQEARALGLEPTWYEFGQHVAWVDPANEALARSVIEDPRIVDTYRALLSGAATAGMGTICHYTGTGDFWGAQQDIFASTPGPRLATLRTYL